MQIVTRQQALKDGLPKYFTGKPCKHGHVAQRYLKGDCTQCAVVGAWARSNPEAARASSRAKSARWSAANKDKVREIFRHWYARDPSKKLAVNKKWRDTHPEQRRVSDRNKKARRRAAPGSHTAQDVAAIRVKQKGRCANCTVDLLKSGEHVDHVKPLALGGENGAKNLQLLCPTCNMRKGAMDPIAFAARMGRLL